MSTSYYPDPQRPHERQPTVRSRANITSACLACKRRKRKCQGGNPCPHCASLRIECCYDERLDKRRKAFNDKARAEIDFQRKVLDGLLRAIKGENADTILEMVRADATLSEIAEKLDTLELQSRVHPSTAQHAQMRDLLPVPNLLQRTPFGPCDPGHSPPTPGASRALEIGDLLHPRSPQDTSGSSPDHFEVQLPPLSIISNSHSDSSRGTSTSNSNSNQQPPSWQASSGNNDTRPPVNSSIPPPPIKPLSFTQRKHSEALPPLDLRNNIDLLREYSAAHSATRYRPGDVATAAAVVVDRPRFELDPRLKTATLVQSHTY